MTNLKKMHAAFVLALFCCHTAFAQENVIVVGQAIDLSGPNAELGRDYVAGITTYFDNININGGINGRKIRYLVRDDQGLPEQASKITVDLLERDKADYLLGGIGTNVTDAVVANSKFSQSNVTLFAPLIGSNKNYNHRVLFWRASPEQEIQYIFSYFDKLGIKSIGLVVQANSLQRDIEPTILSEAKKRNIALSGTVHVSKDPASNDQQSKALALANPQIVITLADTLGTGLFLKSFRKFAPRTFVAGSSLTNLTTLAEIAGSKALEWTVFSQVVPNPAGKKLMLQIEHANLMKKFRDEELSTLTFEGFIVAKTLVRTIQQGRGNEGLKQLVQKTKIDLDGLTMIPSETRLSSNVDIAVFRKGGGLLF